MYSYSEIALWSQNVNPMICIIFYAIAKLYNKQRSSVLYLCWKLKTFCHPQPPFTKVFQHTFTGCDMLACVPIGRISRTSFDIFHARADNLRGLICKKNYLVSKSHKEWKEIPGHTKLFGNWLKIIQIPDGKTPWNLGR